MKRNTTTACTVCPRSAEQLESAVVVISWNSSWLPLVKPDAPEIAEMLLFFLPFSPAFLTLLLLLGSITFIPPSGPILVLRVKGSSYPHRHPGAAPWGQKQVRRRGGKSWRGGTTSAIPARPVSTELSSLPKQLRMSSETQRRSE